MFVVSEIEDDIKIKPMHDSQREEIRKLVTKKFIRRTTKELGLGIHLIDDISILELRLIEDFILSKVSFKLLLFRFVRDEVIEGYIKKQNDKGIWVSLGFYERLFIPRSYIPQENDITYVFNGKKQKNMCWVWKYKGNRLIYQNSEKIRVKVVEYNEKDDVVICSCKDPGLGPISWW